MKFELISRYWDPIEGELFDYLKPYCEIEGNKLFLDIKYLSELKPILYNIPKDIYKDESGWKPDEVIIDFENSTITLRDWYIE